MGDAVPQAVKRGNVFVSAAAWVKGRMPDRTREGFDAAFADALAFCAEYEWQSTKALMDELALMMQDRLRLVIETEIVAVHRSGRPRLVVRAGKHEAREDLAMKITPARSGRAN